jgi:riboflavin biosynthesis pyrimidine reductase
MRRLLPGPAADIDPFVAYGDVPGSPGAPWLRIGMVMSADGSVTDERAWTDGLGGDADFRVFRTLRALADGIMIGAATVRTGRVGPHRLRPELRARREAIGRPAPAPIIVVSGSLALDWTLPVFTAGEPIVVTSAAALERAGLGGVRVNDAAPADTGPENGMPDRVRLVTAGRGTVDLAQAVHELRARFGLSHLLCEGGPALATSVIAAGLADELCLNLAPTLIGGGTDGGHHTRLLGGLPHRVELEPTSVYADEGVLFLRYALPRRA